jgi:uncharacterized phiE125 gp8 family phage protein
MSIWDRGIRWRLDQVTGPDLEDDPLTLEVVRDDHLRCASVSGSPASSPEDAYIRRLMRVSYRAAEWFTGRSLLPQTWDLVMNRFPHWDIVLPRPPLRSITSVTYVDPDGVDRTMDISPATYETSAPSDPHAQHGKIWPVYGTVWPSTRCQPEAVAVRFIAGYPDVGSPALPDIPDDLTQGRLLLIAELYKQRSESVQSVARTQAFITARDLWAPYRVF